MMVKPVNKKPGTCDHIAKTKEENLFRLDIYDILKLNGWKKLNIDSLWSHPNYGSRHVLFAMYLEYRKYYKKCGSIKHLCIGVLIGLLWGAMLAVFIERLL